MLHRQAIQIAVAILALPWRASPAAQPEQGGAALLAQWSLLTAQQVPGSRPGCPSGLVDRAAVFAAMAEAAIAAEGGYRSELPGFSPPSHAGAAASVAVAEAAREVLVSMRPGAAAKADVLLQQTIAAEPDEAARAAGVELGRNVAAAAIEARRRKIEDRVDLREYPPLIASRFIAAGPPVGALCGRETPWFLERREQFRPGPPPTPEEKTWSRDILEVESRGGKVSAVRTDAETLAARRWDHAGTDAWLPLLARLSAGAGRNLAQNARLWALVATAIADAEIAVFDAKYAYLFWRPITAIQESKRPGEQPWEPLLRTPEHPEYPCGHCIVAAAVTTVLAAEFGETPAGGIFLETSGAAAHYTSFSAIVDEVNSARVDAGVHFRNSALVGAAMGRALAARELETAWPPLARAGR